MSPGFHRDKHSFIPKAVGAVVIAGLVAVGLKKGGQQLATALDTVASSSLGQTVIGRVSRTLRSDVMSFELFQEEFMGLEDKVFSQGAKRIRSAVSTALAAEGRTDVFLDQLAKFTQNPDILAQTDVRDRLKQFMSRIGRAQGSTQLGEGLLSHEGIAQFNEQLSAAGVIHNFRDPNQQIAEFKKIVADIHVQPTNEAIDSVLGQQRNSEHVYKMLFESREAQRRSLDVLSLQRAPNARHILWREVHQPEGAVNPYFREDVHGAMISHITSAFQGAGGKSLSAGEATEWLQRHIEQTQEAMSAVFGNKESPVSGHGWDLFLGSRTGFVFNEQKKSAVSYHRIKHVADQLLTRAMGEIQIPLVPFKFNVPVKSLLLAPRTKDFVRDLGALSDNPELMRMAKDGQLGLLNHSQQTQMFSIGDKVMSINGQELRTLDGHFAVYKERDSSAVASLSKMRSIQPGSAEQTALGWKQSSHAQSKLRQMMYHHFDKYAQVGHVTLEDGRSGFIVKPRHAAFGSMVRSVFGEGFVDPRMVHPTALMRFLQTTDNARLPSTDLARILDKVVDEASQSQVNLGDFFRTYRARGGVLPATPGAEGPNSIFRVLNQAMETADNRMHQPPVGDAYNLRHLLFTDLPEHGHENILNLASYLENNVSRTLYRAITMLRTSHHTMDIATMGEGGLTHRVAATVRGFEGISTALSKFQEGMLSQILHGMGAEKYGGYEELGDTVKSIWSSFEEHQAPAYKTLFEDHAFVRDLHKLGIRNSGRLQTLIESLVDSSGPQLRVHYGRLGETASLLLDKREVLGLSQDKVVQAKLVGALKNHLEENSLVSLEHRNLMLRELAYDAHLEETLSARFNAGRPFHPQDLGPNPLGRSRYLVVPNNTPTLKELTDNPHLMYERFVESGSTGDFIRSLVNPSAAHGRLSMWAHLFAMAPEHVARSVGLGLPLQNQMSPLRAGLGWWTKRVLPLYVGLEFYKNLNANAHELGLPGIDDVAANSVANFNLLSAGVKDALGVTSLSKHLVSKFPGLDKYFHPRSRDEYKQYLFYGDEDVRTGRGWITGSRNEMTGGKVQFVRPNFYRRWKSHWTEAPNVDISNPEFSWMPNILHPLAPLKRAMNPQWFVNKHLSDRPYRAGGKGVAQVDPEGNFLETNSFGAFGGYTSIARMGAGFPTALAGGGQPFALTDGHGGTRSSQQGAGRQPGVMMSGAAARPSGIQVTGASLSLYGEPSHLELHKEVPGWGVQDGGVWDTVSNWAQDVRQQVGLFGAVMQRIPFYPQASGPFRRQRPETAITTKRLLFGGQYGEATGTLGEFLRRIVHQDYTSATDFNNLPNNQPSWLPSRFHRGDPYMRTPAGEMNLPGTAYEQLNPWIAPLRVRGSSIGLSEEEIVEKWINPMEPVGDQDDEDIVNFGSRVHKLIQRQLNDSGVLVGAEVSVYDKEHNLSGTIDAVVRGMNGQLELLDIKTQGDKAFMEGETPDKYIDQITAYMAMTGIQRGHLAFVDRNDPKNVRIQSYNFDPRRWQKILSKINRARATAEKLVEKGLISPFETYDLLSRIDILSKVAPDSAEFREAVRFAEEGAGFGGFEQQRYEAALERAKKLNADYRLYPHRYSAPLQTRRLEVESVTDKGDIVTEDGTIKLAGVQFDPQAFAYEDPATVLAKYGIIPGKKIPVTLIQGQFNPDIMNDVTLHAVVGSVNRRLINSQYASATDDPSNPLDSQVVHGASAAGRLWEMLVHSDSMITNKFMRVRSAVEQLERGEVYGTDDSSWMDMIGSFLSPTLNAVASRSPLAGALKGGTIAGIFFRSRQGREYAAGVGALIGAGLSTMRLAYETLKGDVWKPHRVMRREEFDEYWDILQFTKYSTMAEAAKRRARKEEGVDVDQLEQSEKRVRAGLGPWATLAVHAQRRAQQTMYGYDEAVGSLQDAIQALPDRHKQLAESVIETGTIREKRRFYDLISDSEKRVLGKFLGIDPDSTPSKPKLSEYFRHHFLPNVDWAGWQENVSMEDLETRAADDEGIRVMRPNRNRVERARALTHSVPIPKMNAETPGRIMSTLHKLMSRGNFSRVNVKHVIRPSTENVISVRMDLLQDQTHELIAQSRGELYNS